MIKNRLFIILVILLCVLPFAGMLVISPDEAAGNETLTEWPELLDEDGTFNSLFLSDIGDYVEDHFAFRSNLITAASVLNASVFGTSTDEDVIVGTDGWLYYAATLDDYQHNNNVSDRVLFNEAHNLSLVQEWAELQGKTFIVTIAPNKNTLYPSNMPSSLDTSYAEASDLERLGDYLTAEGVNYVDMVELFAAEEEILYYERDSHWTEQGAILAYNALLDAAGIEHETYEDTEPVVSLDYYGDLSEMLYPSGLYPEEHAVYLTEPTFVYTAAESSGISYLPDSEDPDSDEDADASSSDARAGIAASEIEDASTIVEQDTVKTYQADGNGTLFMFRDSFGNSLLPYMAEVFETAVFSEIVPWDFTQEDVLAADVIILEKVERHLPTLSNIAPIMAAVERNYDFTYLSGDVLYSPEEYLRYCLGEEVSDSKYALSGEIAVDDSLLDETQENAGTGGRGSAAEELTDSEADEAAEAEGVSGTGGTIEFAETLDGNYLEISGTVSEEICGVNGRIYAAVTDADGTAVYEAFCVSTDETDYGYTLYLAIDDISDEVYDVRIVVQSGALWTCVCEYRSQEYDEMLESTASQAAQLQETYGTERAWTSYQAYLEIAEARAAEEAAGTAAAEEEDTVSSGSADEEGDDASSESAGEEGGDASSGSADGSDSEEDLSSIIVSQRYIEDCGLDSGYWDITYADGHHEYIDD